MIVPPAYWEKLKREFESSEKYRGLDADTGKGQGYFLEWLVEKLYLHDATPPLPLDKAILKIGINREHKIISLRIGPSLVILKPDEVQKIVDDLRKAAEMIDGKPSCVETSPAT